MAYPKNKTLLETANKLFTNTKINITTEDKGIDELMKPVDEIIKNELLASIIGESITNKEKELYSSPTRLGDLGIPSFVEKAENDFENSLHITDPLVALIATQEESLPDDCNVKQRVNSTKQNKEKLLIKNGNKSELEPDMR